MPWCAGCDRYLSPSTVVADGTCPSCGRTVEPGGAHAPTVATSPAAPAGVPGAPAGGAATDGVAARGPAAEPGGEPDEELGPLPWHLKLLAAALALYLGYRAFQGIEWVVHQL